MGASKRLNPRRLIVYVVSLGILVLAKPEPILFGIGFSLALLGEALRIWGCGHLRKNQDVIMSGPFAYVKNPLYVGTFLIVAGFCLMASNTGEPSRYILFVALPIFVIAFFFYYFPYKVQVEGDRLRRRFGRKFDEYDKNVPNFFPRLTPYGGSKLRWDPSLLTENSEYGILFIVLAGSALIATKFADFSRAYDLWSYLS